LIDREFSVEEEGRELEMPDYIEPGDGRIPPSMVIGLDFKTQHALNHPVRRQLLRCLNAKAAPHTVVQLALELPTATLSQMSYHLKVLARYGAAHVAGEGPPSYMSAIADEPGVLAVLQVTEEWDRVQQRAIVEGVDAPGEGGPVE
jgi:DNA-binding transcriptional ArsR family regulator